MTNAVDTLRIELAHKGTDFEQHNVIMTLACGRQLNVSHAVTERGAKMCLTRYGKANRFTKGADGAWTRAAR